MLLWVCVLISLSFFCKLLVIELALHLYSCPPFLSHGVFHLVTTFARWLLFTYNLGVESYLHLYELQGI
jgi:hypothetical protein